MVIEDENDDKVNVVDDNDEAKNTKPKYFIMIQIQGTFSLACLSLNFPELENIVGTLPKSLKHSLKWLKMT